MPESERVVHDFCECLKHFISQPLDLLFTYEALECVFTIKDSTLVVDCGAIQQMYPAIFWGFRNLAEVFARRYFENGLNVQLVVDDTRIQISREFRLLTSGMNMDLITSISAERYESSEAKEMNMLVIPYPIAPESFESCTDAVLFTKDQRIALHDSNVHALRKQLNMAKDGCLLVGCSKVGRHFSFGIGGKSLLAKYPHIAFRKHVEWEFYVPPIPESTQEKNAEQSEPSGERADSEKEKKPRDAGCRLRYKGGQMWLPLLDTTEAETKKIEDIFCREDCREVIQAVLSFARKADKGTTIVLTTSEIAQAEYERLNVQYNRGFGLHHPYRIQDKDYKEILSRLMAIDGAMLIDIEGMCWACGTILDGEAHTRGNMARGARYNSVPVYIQSLRERFSSECETTQSKQFLVAVIVASEDGMLDILSL